MQFWRSIEKVFTAETIMTPRESMLVWDGVSEVDTIWEQATALQIDFVPVEVGGQITGFLKRDEDEICAITSELTISQNTSMPELIRKFSDSERVWLFVLSDQKIVGLVTPADINKIPARTYFYNITAQFELTIAHYIEIRGFSDEEIIGMLGAKEERQTVLHNLLQDADLELKIIHTLYISEMVNIIRADVELQNQFGIGNGKRSKGVLDSLVHLRNDIVHPSKLILSKNRDIAKLNRYVEYILGFLDEYAIV